VATIQLPSEGAVADNMVDSPLVQELSKTVLVLAMIPGP
jgi:hypothetical protein